MRTHAAGVRDENTNDMTQDEGKGVRERGGYRNAWHLKFVGAFVSFVASFLWSSV